MSIKDDSSINIVVALRAARGILGLTQLEMATYLGISKATLARVEMMETSLRADTYLRAMQLFAEKGVLIETVSDTQSMVIKVSKRTLDDALIALKDPKRRRSDRKPSD